MSLIEVQNFFLRHDCTVENGDGTITPTSTVAVSCQLVYGVDVTVSNMVGQMILVETEQGETKTITADGTYSFDNRITGTAYSINLGSYDKDQVTYFFSRLTA